MTHGSKKAVEKRKVSRAAAKPKCANGCGREVSKPGTICGTCSSKKR